MAQIKVYLVVERQLAYNDCFYDFTGGEHVVHAYRTRERAEQVARALSAENERRIEYSEQTDQNHVVVEAVIEENPWQRLTGTQ